MSEEISVKPLAIGICVSDLDRSIDFYTKALGFGARFERSASADRSLGLELENVRFREVFLTLDALLIALFAYESPPALPANPYAANRLGFTHLAFEVPDIDEAAQRVAAHGGTVLEHTRGEEMGAILMAITDPDGTRLELVQRQT